MCVGPWGLLQSFADLLKFVLKEPIIPSGSNKGVFLPPIPLPRRMGAGRRVTIDGQLRIGTPAIKRAIVAQVLPKIGRTGRMATLVWMRERPASG